MLLKQLSTQDFPALFDFEQRNWDYFAQFVPARPETYRTYETFCNAQNDLLVQQANRMASYHVGYKDQKLVVRANLVDLTDTTADMGYRVCQSVAGQGVATSATTALIHVASHQGLQTITATVSDNNPASRRVLEKNGFEYLRTQKKALKLNGIWLDFLFFERRL